MHYELNRSLQMLNRSLHMSHMSHTCRRASPLSEIGRGSWVFRCGINGQHTVDAMVNHHLVFYHSHILSRSKRGLSLTWTISRSREKSLWLQGDRVSLAKFGCQPAQETTELCQPTHARPDDDDAPFHPRGPQENERHTMPCTSSPCNDS